MPEVEDPNRDPLEVLAAEFIVRQRGGEHPAISDYTARYPDLAEQIEELFPTIAAMERLKTQRGSRGGLVSLGGPRLERLGDFRILREIGRGGMGIVYEAFQESLGRHVAVKVLPRQSLLDPRHLQRFQRESQTAARLHHTNIVPVFGIGEQEGFHYIVMQLIRGVGLDAVLVALQGPGSQQTAPRPAANEAGRLARMLATGQFSESGDRESSWEGLAEPPPEDLAPAAAILPELQPLGPAYWRSTAAIGLQVAEALHYAHAHHTLHRDIKPANLLLDSQGVVWITDFGLAKAMEQDDVTRTGALVGTLRYMAPEQFSGHVDARSDIYSLGLTLYELFTLRPAFEETARNNLIRKITHEEPVAPRKLNPQIPHDLETIVLKAIACDPARRYASAAELARDLQRFLEDRPIEARRSSNLERLWRWSRRNPLVASLATSTLALLVLVALVASAGYVHTTRANVEEAYQREKAERTSALALEALDNIFQQFAPDRIPSASTLKVVGNTGEELAVPVQPVLSNEAAAMLEHMLAFYDRLADQGGDDGKLRRKVAEANRRVGDIRQRLGDHEQSKTAYLRAVDLYRQLADDSRDDAELRTQIARIQNELGNLYCATDDPQSGNDSYKDALATLQAVSGTAAESPSHRYELARTYYYLGRRPGPSPMILGGLRGGHRGPGGMGGPRGPRELGGPGGPDEPGGPGGPDRGRGFERPGRFTPGMGPDNARDRLHSPRGRASEFAGPPRFAEREPPRDLGREPPRDARGSPDGQGGPGPPFLHFNPEEMDENLDKAIAILQRLTSENPAVPAYRHLLACCYREQRPNFGSPPAKSQEAASDNRAKAIEILQKLVDEYPDVPDYRYDLSETYAMQGFHGPFPGGPEEQADQQGARETLGKALAVSEELVAEHPNIPDYAASQVFIRVRLAELQRDDAAAAEASLRKALDTQTGLVRRYPRTPAYKFTMAVIRESLADLLQEGDRLPEARQLLQESIAALEEVLEDGTEFTPAHGVLGYHYMRLAELLRRMGETAAADEARGHAERYRPEHDRRDGKRPGAGARSR